MEIKHRSFKETLDTLVEGIQKSYENCPDSENKTFEEVADWAGKHVLITEKKENGNI